MAKLYKVDMNISTENVAPQLLVKEPSPEKQAQFETEMNKWRAKDTKKRGEAPKMEQEKMNGAEFVKVIVMASINQVHKTGNVNSLRRTKNIAEKLSIAINKEDGILLIGDDDYKYIRSALNKADQWNNNIGVANSILAVDDCVSGAVEIDEK